MDAAVERVREAGRATSPPAATKKREGGRQREWDAAADFAERYMVQNPKATYRAAHTACGEAGLTLPGDHLGLKAAIHYRRKEAAD
jgi:hypothetical protein